MILVFEAEQFYTDESSNARIQFKTDSIVEYYTGMNITTIKWKSDNKTKYFVNVVLSFIFVLYNCKHNEKKKRK